MEYIIAMTPQGGDGGGLLSTFIMFGAIFAIFYFMIIRPQQKRAKERDKMLSETGEGDKIVTSGGMHGTIAGMDEKTILVDVGNNVKIKFEKSAIASVTAQKDK